MGNKRLYLILIICIFMSLLVSMNKGSEIVIQTPYSVLANNIYMTGKITGDFYEYL